MDFFRSILSDDPEPETLANSEQSDSNSPQFQSPIHSEINENDSNSNSDDGDGNGNGNGAGIWSFGDLVKTLTTKSESVFETYRRDLKEFGTGLKLESELFKEVASRAVKELPEVSTSAIDGVIKSTAEIISQGKVALLSSSDNTNINDSDTNKSNSLNHLRKYSRFDSILNSIQNDSKTYVEEPEDVEEYKKWKLGFVVGEMREEIEELVGDENGKLAQIYRDLVPSEVDDGTFWFRYFYKVHKLKQQEDMRAKLVKRSLDVDEEEDLSWDIDDEDDVDDDVDEEDSKLLKSNTSKDENVRNVDNVDNNTSIVEKAEEKVDMKVDFSNVVKSDESLSREEEDLEWDEIEDLGNDDEKKESHSETSSKGEIIKRLSGNEDEDEDLSWDIEDDDDDDSEPVKTGNK